MNKSKALGQVNMPTWPFKKAHFTKDFLLYILVTQTIAFLWNSGAFT